ncbi:MAG: CsbD family protein [Anaerolineae bacterium]|jgi:uncharacterized protein YjbJ (UPF0337 family)|nr:CsbD family protein [Anaerolineae bacterium]
MSDIKVNWDRIAGEWKQYTGAIQKQWGKLTNDEVAEINGNRTVLAGKLQEKYGLAKEHANKEIDKWMNTLTK